MHRISLLVIAIMFAAVSQAEAVVLVQESFDYAESEAVALNTLNGGIGWDGAWHMGAGDADDMKIVSGLSFGTLPVSGNSHAGRLNLEAQLHRNFATPLTDGSQDLWVGFLAQRVGGGPQVSLYSASSAALFHIGHSSGTSNTNWVIASVEGNANKVIGSGISFNELTYFVVGISYDLDAGTTHLSVEAFTNGDLSTPATTDSFVLPHIEGITGLRVVRGMNFDEFIVATTRAEVIPEPASLVLMGMGGMLVLRRRR